MEDTREAQSILIVGGGNGIGSSIVRSILTLSPSTTLLVFDNDASAIEDLLTMAKSIKQSHRICSIVGDVTNKEDRLVCLKRCTEQGVDTLVYCAGTINPIERLSDLDIDEVKTAYEINVFGCMAMVQICLKHLRRSRYHNPTNYAHGKILILSSACDADVTYHGWIPYCTTKAALTRFIACLAHEEPTLFVQGVYPKLTRTKMPAEVIAGRYTEVMADHEIERFKVWSGMGDEMVEPPEWCGEAVAKLALGLYEGGKSGETKYYDEHIPKKITGT